MRLPGVQIASHGSKQRCPLWWSQFLWSYPTVVLVFPNMELSVIPASAWIYIWNAWIMQIFSFLLHLTLSSIKSINHPIRWSQWPVIFPHTHTNTAWKTAAEQLVRNWWGRLDITCFFCFYGGFRRDKKGQNPPTPSSPLWIMLFCWLWGSLMKLLFSILWQKCFFPLLFNSGSVRGHLSCSLREISVTSVLHLS